MDFLNFTTVLRYARGQKQGEVEMYAVVVHLEIDADRAEPFMELMRANADASLRDEPGCLRFDICSDRSRPGDVFLYELYTDAAAFAAHQEMPHYAAFNEAAGDMIEGKIVDQYRSVVEAHANGG